MSDSMLLILLIALPFVGSLIAALLPTNARNAEAWLAGAIALSGLLITASYFQDDAAGKVARIPRGG